MWAAVPARVGDVPSQWGTGHPLSPSSGSDAALPQDSLLPLAGGTDPFPAITAQPRSVLSQYSSVPLNLG